MLNSVRVVSNELAVNFERIVRIAKYENKAEYKGTILGILWNLLNPALQIFVYWLVFSSGLRGIGPKDGIPYALWITLGILPWITMNSIMNTSMTSMVASSSVIKNLSIPVSIIPMITVISKGIVHLWSMLVMLVILLLYDIMPTWHIFEVIYYTIAGGFIMTGLSLIFSSLNVVLKDFQRIMQPIFRLLMYVTAVIVPLENFSPKLQSIFRLNPLTYVVEGYRYCLIYNTGIEQHWVRGVYFWGFALVIYLLGCWIHVKLRKQIVDLV